MPSGGWRRYVCVCGESGEGLGLDSFSYFSKHFSQDNLHITTEKPVRAGRPADQKREPCRDREQATACRGGRPLPLAVKQVPEH